MLSRIGYGGANGPALQLTSATMGSSSSYSASTYRASYDADGRLTTSQYQRAGTTRFRSRRAYDAVGNVLAVSTTLPAGVDTQHYCYDAFNRLVSASAYPGSTPPVEIASCGPLLATDT